MAYAGMTIVVVALFAVLLITFISSFNRETELKHQKEVFEANLAKVDAVMGRAYRLAQQVASNHEILNVFIPLDEPENKAGGGGNYFDDNLLDSIRISSLISGFNDVDEFADRISVYNRYSDYVGAGRLYEPPERVQKMLNNVENIDMVTEEVRQRADHCLVLELNVDKQTGDPYDSYITLYQTLSYTESSAAYGLVSVQLSADHLLDLGFWGEEGNGEYFMINDWKANALEPLFLQAEGVDLSALYKALTALWADAQEGLPPGVWETVELPYRLGGRDVILLASRPYPSNWLMVRALPVSALSEPYRQSYVLMTFGHVALLVFLLFVVNFMAERISRPLRRLSRSIAGIGLQNLRLPDVPKYSTDELAALNESFRQMLKRLDQSIQVELQAYMRVLQSQMNPHFLYNVLSVIVASSEAHGDQHTAAMCLRLTSMLRYVSDIKRETATLDVELEHTRNYLDLMKERYEDLFDYEIHVPETAFAIEFPRLTVQPLAENCFVHGFKNEPPWHMRIEAHSENGRWALRVIDNGVGVTEEQISSIEERFKEYKRDVAGHYQDLSLGGMGLINTRLRLALMFGDALTYRMENRPEGGLMIEIGGPLT